MRGWMMGLAALAGLFGAAGVTLAAVAAHLSGDPALKTAADFLLYHAGALLGLAACMHVRPNFGVLAAASLLCLGTILVCSDLSLHALAGVRLFPMAAPTGGILLIGGWIAAAVAVPLALRARPSN